MTPTRPALVRGAIVLALVLGAALGGLMALPSGGAPPQRTGGVTAGTQPIATATAVPAAKPTALAAKASPTPVPREQSLRYPITEPPTLDPGLATDSVSIDVINQAYEGLIGFDESGNSFGLGAERWEISPDGLTYAFFLRDGPRWSDGRLVTAKDYEWAWKRNVDPRTASDYATTLYPIKNAAKIHREGLDPGLLGVEARDERTLVVSLEQPAAFFPRLASTWTMMPLRQDVVERFGDKWTEAKNVVTNGPFLIKEWQHDGQIVLERNDRYWGEKPPLAKVTYRIFPEGAGEQVLATYEAGDLDTLGSGTSFEIPTGQVDRVLADPRLKQEVREFDQSATMFLTVNNRRPHLKDPRVRIALGQAIERERLLNQVLRRVARPASSLQPVGIAGRKPELWPQEDLEQARARMAEAGFPEGRGFPEITFTYNANPQWKLMAEYLQQRYRDGLGVKLNVEAMEWSAFLRWRRGEDWQTRGDLYRGGWFSDYEDPTNWYNVLWDSREDPAVFSSGWKSEGYDRVVRQAQAELDPGKREQAYQQAERTLAEGYPNIPVFHYAQRTLVKSYVENLRPERVLGLTSLRKVRLSDRR